MKTEGEIYADLSSFIKTTRFFVISVRKYFDGMFVNIINRKTVQLFEEPFILKQFQVG